MSAAAPDRETVVVTGGSGGIGGAIIDRFLAEGATVANIDRQPSGRHPSVPWIEADLANAGAIGAAFGALDAVLGDGAPAIFVGCAAISRATPALDVTAEEIDQILAVNVRGTFLAAQAAARRMKAAGRGSIVLISSVAAEQAWAMESIYAASKAATRSLVQSLAVELAPFGIRVNGIGPGPIDHQAQAMASTRANPEIFRHEIERTPLGRFGRPEEVADAVALIARTPWATGQTLYVDGGYLATGLGYFGAAKNALLG